MKNEQSQIKTDIKHNTQLSCMKSSDIPFFSNNPSSASKIISKIKEKALSERSTKICNDQTKILPNKVKNNVLVIDIRGSKAISNE